MNKKYVNLAFLCEKIGLGTGTLGMIVRSPALEF